MRLMSLGSIGEYPLMNKGLIRSRSPYAVKKRQNTPAQPLHNILRRQDYYLEDVYEHRVHTLSNGSFV